jgi:hypothetical protein
MTSCPDRRSEVVTELAEDETYLIVATIDFLAAFAPGAKPLSKRSFWEL